MRVLLIDNFDSFTYNLVHYMEPLVEELVVWRNDQIHLEDVALFDKIIFSPGPELPSSAPGMMDIIAQYHDSKPMLGVCLGFQAMVEFFGGELVNLNLVKHGVKEEIEVSPTDAFFAGCNSKEFVGLYHSWGVTKTALPECLTELGYLPANQMVMAMKHRQLPLYGVQFHPESILTPNGKRMLKNWINL